MKQSTLFSIGHGSKSIEELIGVLHQFGIQYLVDVRSKPFSKYYPQFNKECLEQFINHTDGITYVYMGDKIGGLPDDEACKTNGKMDYDKMKKMPYFIEGLERLLHANELGLNLCVMCSESNPAECHRSKLIGEALRERDINMRHICKGHNGQYFLKSQIDVMNELGGTVCLFGHETLTSRNTY